MAPVNLTIVEFLINKNQPLIDKLPLAKRMFGYYGFWMKYGQRYCENCLLLGKETVIDNYGLFSAQAHILPKRQNQFPSVAANLWNHLTLGTVCGCHYRYDRSWEDAAAMPIFEMAEERFLLFKDKIIETDRIPEAFLKLV